MSHSAQQPFPMIAAIDLGSNSFHLVLAKTTQQGVDIFAHHGEKVQLAAGIDAQLKLQDDAMQRGFACLKRFAQYTRDLPQGAVRIVGTSSLRVAHNRQRFIEQAEQILGHRIDIISGREEARLIYLSVAHTLHCPEKRLVIDIGGGSTEFIIGQKFATQLRDSLQIGCVSLSQRFFSNGKVTAESYQQAYTAARLELLELEQNLHRSNWQATIGASGTICSVGQALVEAGLSTGDINRQGLQWLKQQVLAIAEINKINIPGVSAARSSILPAGLVIIEAIFDALEISQMTPSSSALREGLIYDLLDRQQQRDPREVSIQALAERTTVDSAQLQSIEQWAQWALHQVANTWQLTDQWHRKLLSWAVRVHLVGLDIAHYHYHKHGAYLVEHSDLAGFSRQEQQMLALLVRGHRRNIPIESFQQLPQGNGQPLLYLCVLLRLAILLQSIKDSQTLSELQLSAQTNQLTLVFPKYWLANNPLAAARLQQETQWLQRSQFCLIVK